MNVATAERFFEQINDVNTYLSPAMAKQRFSDPLQPIATGSFG